VTKVKVLSATSRQRLDGVRYGAVDAFKDGQRVSPTVAGIDVEHHQSRDRSGDDADVGVGPLSPPSPDLLDASSMTHAFLPESMRVLA
jgi:hypothetical protein